jgi:branched-subunit amino acid transport protein
MNYWLILIGMGLVTFGTRLLPIVLLGRIEIPVVVQRALRFVPPAVLSAIIAPELLMPGRWAMSGCWRV